MDMDDAQKLISDGIINKKTLVLKRHSFLGFDETQAMFISKIFKKNDSNYSNLSIEDLSKIFNVTKNTTEKIIKSLISEGYIRVFYEEKKMKFDFSNLIKSLLETYGIPVKSSSLKKKII